MNGVSRPQPAQYGERLGAAEARHGVVAEHDVPVLLVERLEVVPGGIDPAEPRLDAAAAQLAKAELGIVGRILDDEHAQARPVDACPCTGAIIFRSGPVSR